jgi:hypothetical protein
VTKKRNEMTKGANDAGYPLESNEEDYPAPVATNILADVNLRQRVQAVLNDKVADCLYGDSSECGRGSCVNGSGGIREVTADVPAENELRMVRVVSDAREN